MMMLRVPPPHYRPDLAYSGGYRNPPDAQSRRRLAKRLASEHGLRLVEDWPMPALSVDCYILEAPTLEAGARELAALALDPRVESVQFIQRFRGLAAGEDPLEPAQAVVRDWRLRELHRVATGNGVLVASIDSGLDESHPDLRGQDIAVRNFVDGQAFRAEGHGTSVGGIIVAKPDNGAGIVGIAPDAGLLALRACEQSDAGQPASCDTFGLAKALQFALDAKARVVNLSLTGPQDRLLGRLIDVALQRGAIVVGAVDPDASDAGFPASHPGVLAVTGTDDSRALAQDVVRVPDRGIPAPVPGGGWNLVSGSSFATAQVSGLAALLLQIQPRANAGAIRMAIASTRALGSADRTGAMDACGIVERISRRCACDCKPSPAAGGSRK